MSNFKPSYEKYTTVDAIETTLVDNIAAQIDTLLSTPYENITWASGVANGLPDGLSYAGVTNTANLWINVYRINPMTQENTPCVACWYSGKDACCANVLNSVKTIFSALSPTLEKDKVLIIPFPTKTTLDAILTAQRKDAANNFMQDCVVCEGHDVLDCSNKGLYELQFNLKNFTFTNFYCDNNKLTCLPELPQTVVCIVADNNQLKQLGKLPPNLERLSCDNNKLISLPPLPSTLTILNCENNLLISLPELPASLRELRCFGNNSLECLPDLPEGLQKLEWMSNLLANRYPRLWRFNSMKEKIEYVNRINAFYRSNEDQKSF